MIALRELTALSDELADLALRPGMRTVVLRPARLTFFRDAVARFIESRDEAEWVREEDREPLARVRALLYPLEDLCGDALRAALRLRPGAARALSGSGKLGISPMRGTSPAGIVGYVRSSVSTSDLDALRTAIAAASSCRTRSRWRPRSR